MDKAGLRAVDLTAERIAGLVDELLGNRWNRSAGEFINPDNILPLQVAAQPEPVEARGSCGSGIPVRRVMVDRASGHFRCIAADLRSVAPGGQAAVTGHGA